MIERAWAEFAAAGRDSNPPCAATIGVFDGVHRGHRELLRMVAAAAPGLTPTVLTFRDNPKAVTRGNGYECAILSQRRKLAALAELGIVQVVLIDFSANFGKLTGKEFIGQLRDRGNLRYLVVGSDFRCGYGLDTDAEQLKEMNRAAGVPTDIVPPVVEAAAPISSSRIRAAIAAGRLVEAAALLGRNVEVDLVGLAATPGADGTAYDVSDERRIVPPQGRYPVKLFDRSDSFIAAAEARIDGGRLVVPGRFECVRVEFVM
jgi:riboflavin kinase/FMN adenylyltransferase